MVTNYEVLVRMEMDEIREVALNLIIGFDFIEKLVYAFINIKLLSFICLFEGFQGLFVW
jgi:hypothetical protein